MNKLFILLFLLILGLVKIASSPVGYELTPDNLQLFGHVRIGEVFDEIQVGPYIQNSIVNLYTENANGLLVTYNMSEGDNKIFGNIGGLILGNNVASTNFTLSNNVLTSLDVDITTTGKLFIQGNSLIRTQTTITVDGVLIVTQGTVLGYVSPAVISTELTLPILQISPSGTLVMVGQEFSVAKLINLDVSVLGGSVIADGFVILRNTSFHLSSLAEMDIIRNGNSVICHANQTSGNWIISNSVATFREYHGDEWIKELGRNTKRSSWTVNCETTRLETSGLIRIKDSVEVTWNSPLELLDNSAELRVEDNSSVVFMSNTTVEGLLTVDPGAFISISPSATFRQF